MLDLFNVEKPSKWGRYWLQNGDEGGDSLQMSLNTPFEGKYFENVQWEDNEPLKVSLVPNKTLERCKSMSENVACMLQKFDLAMSHKDPKEVCQSLNEMTMLYARMTKFLVELSGYLEE